MFLNVFFQDIDDILNLNVVNIEADAEMSNPLSNLGLQLSSSLAPVLTLHFCTQEMCQTFRMVHSSFTGCGASLLEGFYYKKSPDKNMLYHSLHKHIKQRNCLQH